MNIIYKDLPNKKEDVNYITPSEEHLKAKEAKKCSLMEAYTVEHPYCLFTKKGLVPNPPSKTKQINSLSYNILASRD